ncbi:hypothetical protein NKH77_07615 [Streptomyces sp. M19]
MVGGEQLDAAQVAAVREAAPDAVVFNEYGPTETVVGCCAQRAGTPARAGADRRADHGCHGGGSRGRAPAPTGVPGNWWSVVSGSPGAISVNLPTRPPSSSWTRAPRRTPLPHWRRGAAAGHRSTAVPRAHRPAGQDPWVPRGVGRDRAGARRAPGRGAGRGRAVPGPGRWYAAGRLLVSGPGPGHHDRTPDAGQLRGWLAERLPRRLVPTEIQRRDDLPLTRNGKVDYAALPETRDRRDRRDRLIDRIEALTEQEAALLLRSSARPPDTPNPPITPSRPDSPITPNSPDETGGGDVRI